MGFMDRFKSTLGSLVPMGLAADGPTEGQIVEHSGVDRSPLGGARLDRIARFGYPNDHGQAFMFDAEPTIQELYVMRRFWAFSLALSVLKGPLISTKWTLQGGDERARDFIREAFFGDLLHAAVDTALLSLDYGYSPCEIVWGRDNVTISDGDTSTTMQDMWVVRRIVDIDARDVKPIVSQGQVIGIEVRSEMVIPEEKVAWATFREESGNKLGRPLLNHGFHLWKRYKEEWLRFARHTNKKTDPPQIVTSPEGTTRVTRNGKTQDIDNRKLMTEAASNARAGGVVAIPWTPDESGTNMWSIREMDVSDQVESYVRLLEHIEARMMRSVWVPERVVSQDTQVGGFSANQTHWGALTHVMDRVMRKVCQPFVQGVIDKLVRFNFAGAEAPTAEPGKIADDALALMSKIVRDEINTPRRTNDGKVYTIGQLMDPDQVLESLGIPHQKVAEVPQVPHPHARAEDEFALSTGVRSPWEIDYQRHPDLYSSVEEAREAYVDRQMDEREAKDAVRTPDPEAWGEDGLPDFDFLEPEGEGKGLQDSALGGSQISQAVGIVEKVKNGAIPEESAIPMLMRFFSMSREEAEEMIAPAAREAEEEDDEHSVNPFEQFQQEGDEGDDEEDGEDEEDEG